MPDDTSAASPETADQRRKRIRTLWKERGVSGRSATVLHNLGCETTYDVTRVGYEGVSRHPGVGAAMLKEIGALIQADWPPTDPETGWWREKAARLAWVDRGVSQRTITVLLKNNCKTPEDIRRTDYSAFLKTIGAGQVTLKEIGALIDEDWPLRWWTEGPRSYRDAKAEDLRAELEARGYTVTPP